MAPAAAQVLTQGGLDAVENWFAGRRTPLENNGVADITRTMPGFSPNCAAMPPRGWHCARS
jgi:hypothetical protein